MGISLLTVLTIQANKAEVATGRSESGKYGFEIYSIIREHYRPHLTSQPVYDTDDIARQEGEKLLRDILAINLNKKRKELSGLLGEAAEPVAEIVAASKSGR